MPARKLTQDQAERIRTSQGATLQQLADEYGVTPNVVVGIRRGLTYVSRRLTVEERFWKKVNQTGDCWLWTGKHINSGYGQFGVSQGLWKLTHRYSWELANGPIPTGMCVCHRCDTPLCCRPDHLFLGTQAENLADMRRKGRR